MGNSKKINDNFRNIFKRHLENKEAKLPGRMTAETMLMLGQHQGGSEKSQGESAKVKEGEHMAYAQSSCIALFFCECVCVWARADT